MDEAQANQRLADAVALLQGKRHAEALALLDAILAAFPGSVMVVYYRAVALQFLGRREEAMAGYDAALRAKPSNLEMLNNCGVLLREMGRLEEALATHQRVLAMEPGNQQANLGLGSVLRALGREEEAVRHYGALLALHPDWAEAHANSANALTGLRRFDEAITGYDRALTLRPGNPEFLRNRAAALGLAGRHEEALAAYGCAIGANPNNPELHRLLGDVHQALKQPNQARACFERAIALNPGYVDAWLHLGDLLTGVNHHREALEAYEKALVLRPAQDWLPGMILHTRMNLCDWTDHAASRLSILGGIRDGRRVSATFPILAIPSSLEDQRRCAETYVRAVWPPQLKPLWKGEIYRHNRIRVGYFSADFFNHATCYLMAEMLELHDRSRFELVGFSYGPKANDDMSRRVAGACDRFLEVGGLTDLETARLARELEIDIAIDLKGHTTHSRLGIFSHRFAPVQAHYLGYPGTTGAAYIDYLIADPVLIPPDHRPGYSEKIAYLPDTYQVNDRRRAISPLAFTRRELGLPENGFVFCCFNNNYKITPEVFDVWMRLLKRVPGSVLWLLEGHGYCSDNLRAQAEKRGVPGDRLVFAGRLPLAEHLARHRLADLFLDSPFCNAHTTASDALWAGLPVVTVLGETFVGRVAGSLLQAIGLPELVTTTVDSYESLALELATQPARLTTLRNRLEANRLTTPLFDTPRFVANLENLLVGMHNRSQAGLPPEHLTVQPAMDYATAAVQMDQALDFLKNSQPVPAREILENLSRHFPDNASVVHCLGASHHMARDYQKAEACFARAHAMDPSNAEALANRSITLCDLGRLQEAVDCARQATVLRPQYPEGYCALGDALTAMGNHPEALQAYDRALAVNSDHAPAWYSRGNALSRLGREQEALAAFDEAIRLKPDYLDAFINMANSFTALGRHAEAMACHDSALALDPGYHFLPGIALHTRMHQCEWGDFQERCGGLLGRLDRGESVAMPFPLLAIGSSLAQQRRAAESYSAWKYPPSPQPLWKGERYRHDRIRVGYFSADFHNHATAFLMAELFELHDRKRFEWVGLSYGPKVSEVMGQRVARAFDTFLEVGHLTDREIAAKARELEIDIAVDLKGHTTNTRLGIHAHRPAPVQAHYIGYPGTLGMSAMDYLIADPVLVPPEHRAAYREKIAYLPDCYQVNDRQRPLPTGPVSRSSQGLPERGFVFCCFNNNYKITPDLFDVWMRLLGRVPGSVLWLLEDNKFSVANLRKQARARGVDPARLVFAGRVPPVEHLARQRSADLFLDTFHYNAHTTGSDALWAGLPLVTRLGSGFVNRVAASLLTAVGMPELITHTAEEYEALAYQLATDPERLASLRQRLEANRLSAPRFDTPRLARNLESLFQRMHTRHQASLAPDHLGVEVAN